MGGYSVLSDEILRGYEDTQEITKDSRGVILIPIEYKEERWFMGKAGVYILPCNPPTPFVMGEMTGPLVRILDRQGVAVYTLAMPMDPRIILYEGPSDLPNILEEVSFVLKLPLVEGANTIEYYIERDEDGSVEKKEPVIQVDLREAIDIYEEKGGREQIAECQEPEYKPDALGKED